MSSISFTDCPVPRSPRTPPLQGSMVHNVQHRFTKSINIKPATCGYCHQKFPILGGNANISSIYLKITANMSSQYWEVTANMSSPYWEVTPNMSSPYWEVTPNMSSPYWDATPNTNSPYWEITANKSSPYWEVMPT